MSGGICPANSIVAFSSATFDSLSTQSRFTVAFVIELEEVTTQFPPFFLRSGRRPSAIAMAAKKFSAKIFFGGAVGPTACN